MRTAIFMGLYFLGERLAPSQEFETLSWALIVVLGVTFLYQDVKDFYRGSR